MSALGVVTGHVSLAVSIDVSILGISASMSAPSCYFGMCFDPVSTVTEQGIMLSFSMNVTDHFGLLVTSEVSESSPLNCS